MKMMTKSRSIDQETLTKISEEVCEQIDSLLESLGIDDYRKDSKMITMCCPIHGGDNPSALNLYYEGNTYKGNWNCRTHQCEEHFKKSIIGFVRGVLSHQKYGWENKRDDTVSFNEAVEYCLAFLNKNLKFFAGSKKDQDKRRFASSVATLNNKIEKPESKITRNYIRKLLKIPSPYHLKDYSAAILDRYDVGECVDPSKPFYHRSVVPIYDNDYKFIVGFTARSIYEECEKCSKFHNPKNSCPKDEAQNYFLYGKWRHSFGFKADNFLYNFWFAQKHIQKTSTAILVESPGNVWRLEENNIHNSVGLFGSSLKDGQKLLLDSSGAMNLVVITDNDDAGEKCFEQIQNKCQRTYNIHRIKISKPDVGKMTSEDIDKEVKPQLERFI